MADRYALLVTCEHGGNRVPSAFASLFREHGTVLTSHRGYDPGALDLARGLARRFRAPLVASRVTRLLVELNRSPGGRNLFSPITRTLPAAVRGEILARYYRPHRDRVREEVNRRGAGGDRVLHVAVHTFTPELGGKRREADVGLLYDPGRRGEREVCLAWQDALAARAPTLRVRRNYPYRGVSDGLPTTLRREFGGGCYLGVELEVNQRFPLGEPGPWRALRRTLADSLEAVLRHAGESGEVETSKKKRKERRLRRNGGDCAGPPRPR